MLSDVFTGELYYFLLAFIFGLNKVSLRVSSFAINIKGTLKILGTILDQHLIFFTMYLVYLCILND